MLNNLIKNGKLPEYDGFSNELENISDENKNTKFFENFSQSRDELIALLLDSENKDEK